MISNFNLQGHINSSHLDLVTFGGYIFFTVSITQLVIKLVLF